MLFWQAKTGVEAASAVVEAAKRDESPQSARRSVSIKYASLYEGLQMSSLAPLGYAVDSEACFYGTEVPIIRNDAHAVVDTFVSKIGALDTPKPALLTTEGSWRDRRQAKDLERLLEAEYLSPKGEFATLNELWIHALRVAASATGAVLVRFFNDSGAVGAKIHDSLDCTVSNDGRWVIIKTWYEVDEAVDLFPKRKADIRAAAKPPPLEQRSPQRTGFTDSDMVCIYEGWRGAKGGQPGTYVAALDSGVEALVFEEYEHERPPVVKLVVIPHLYGPWGHSLTHHLFESCYRDNVIQQSIDRSIANTNKSRTYAVKSKLDDPESLETSDDNDVVYVSDTGSIPVTVSPPGFNKDHLMVADRHHSDAHSVPGVSEMHSAGRREPGVDSAIGQRFVAALINERFAAVQRRYVQAVAVDSAKVIIQILCDIFQDDRKLTRHWPGQDSLREVSAAVALRGIQGLKYVIQPAAVSGSRNSPADRQQAAFELFKSGVLSADAIAGLQGSGYDLPEAIDERDTQKEWLDVQIDRWMFASDKEFEKPDFYLPPLKHMDIPRALLRTIDGLLEAQMEQLEEERQEMFLMMLADLDSLLPEQAPAPPGAPMPPTTTPPMPNDLAA